MRERAPEPFSPPLAPGSSFERGQAIALAGIADTSGLDDAQIDAMFDAALAQARPGEDKRAVCVAMQDLGDRAVKDAPERVIARLAGILHLPAVPASHCRFDEFPFVICDPSERDPL